MSNDRLTRVNELLRRELGQALFQVIHEPDFDMSAVTVTRVDVAPNLRTAHVWVSILDSVPNRGRMFGTLKKHRADLQGHIGKNLNLKYTPRLTLILDDSLAAGHNVLELIDDLPPIADEETD